MDVMTLQEVREWVVFENEGKKLFGMLHSPLVDEPPLVITMHGFASHKVGSGRSYVRIAEALCSVGIACLRFDFRGSGDSEGQLSDMTLENFISDALVATHYAEERGFSRIGYFGSSFGGTVAILSAARLTNVKALAMWAPVASGELWFQDFVKMHPQTTKNLVEMFSTFRGVQLHPQFREQFGRMMACQTLEQLTAIPFLHFQGQQDETISLRHQQAFQKHREGAIASSRFITYPQTKHTLGHAAVFPEVVKESIQWFKEYL